jgi:hypothetical protein
MKTGNIIQADTILVATDDQFTGCGIRYIKKDSIIKVARDNPEWRESVKVYRNADAEALDNYHVIDLENVREATLDEIRLWENEVYFINETNIIEL